MSCLRIRIRATAILGFGLILLTTAIALAQDAQLEYKLKAAFLFNFAKFVEWPTESLPADKSPFVIGVLGDNPFDKNLENAVRDKTVNEHPVVVKQFSSASEATNCHILFISSSVKDLPEVIKTLEQSSVLTVGESDRFLEEGGMIKFVIEAQKIRFQIKDEAAKKAKLKLSSKLLNLALRPGG